MDLKEAEAVIINTNRNYKHSDNCGGVERGGVNFKREGDSYPHESRITLNKVEWGNGWSQPRKLFNFKVKI